MYIHKHTYLTPRYSRVTSSLRHEPHINFFDITAFRLFNMNHCEALIFSHEADWGIRLDTVLCPRFHPFEIIR